MPGVVINAFQSAAADCGFRETFGASVERGELLVQTQITRSFRQRADQRIKRLRRHVVRDEKLGVSKSGSYQKGHIVVIALIDKWRSGFQFVRQHSTFFGGDYVWSIGSALPLQHLLIIPRVHLVARFELRQFQIIFARLFQFAGLRVRVRQKLVDFGEVRVLAGLEEESKHGLQRFVVFLDVANDRAQRFHQFVGMVA